MLRFFIKVLLFPITLALTLLVAFARFFCLFSRMVLSIIAGAFFFRGADAVHWRVAGLHRFLPSGMGNQPLRTAGGGVLADGTDGRYKQYAESNLIAIHKPGTAAEKCCRVQFR